MPGLSEVLAAEGWPKLQRRRGDGDPGRFHRLFGRDRLITSLRCCPARPDVAAATLRALAAIQGTHEDVTGDEEPGNIVHEVRPGVSVARQEYLGLEVPDGELRYYGSAHRRRCSCTCRRRPATPPSPPSSSPTGAPPATGCSARSSAAAACCAGTGAPRRPRPAGLARLGGPGRLPVQGSGILHEDGSPPSRRWPTATRRPRRSPACAPSRGCRATAPTRTPPGRWRRASARRATPRRRPRCDYRPVRAGSQLGRLLWAGRSGSTRRRGAPGRARRPHRVRAADAVERLAVRSLLLSPRFHLAVRLVAGLGGRRAAGRDQAAERVRNGCSRAPTIAGYPSSTRSRRRLRGVRLVEPRERVRWARRGRCERRGRRGARGGVTPLSTRCTCGRRGLRRRRGRRPARPHARLDPRPAGRRRLWLNPSFPSPNADRGYDVSDYCGASRARDARLTSTSRGPFRRVRHQGAARPRPQRHELNDTPWFSERRDFYVWH